MIEHLIKTYLENPTEINAFNIVCFLRKENQHSTGLLIGLYFSKIYSYDLNIRAETAVCAYYSKNYKISYDLYTENLKNRNLNEHEANILKINRHFSINYIADNHTNYNQDIITQILNKPVNPLPLITFTITTCKRFDLFEKTINSFLNCCKDLKKIDHWFCVDDNSSDEDRKKMEEKYPFFTFYWKTISEKGHPRSMNIIRETVRTPYIFHMEDDWKFFEKRNYISECMEVLSSNPKIGQCLINKNYAETSKDIHIAGAEFFKTSTGLRYYIHEYSPEGKLEKYKNTLNCVYWPHFSFRPSLLRKSVFNISSFNETIGHFEMEYSYKYIANGFISAFLESIYCLHIGRLTSQRNDKTVPNAYELNNESQFIDKKQKVDLQTEINTYVINLDQRVDRLENFEKKSPVNYIKFSGIDGNKLKPNEQLQRIFEGNDYNMRSGMVGIAVTHIKLWIQLLNESDNNKIYFIMEDDVTFSNNFNSKINNILTESKNIEWDFIYLGHHLYPSFRSKDYCNEHIPNKLEKWNTQLSLSKSMGGFFSYLINKSGAEKLLNFINKNGMTNGIDTVQQKGIDDNINTYYCFPHIVFSECVLPDQKVDSDIQYNFNSLSLDTEQLEEIKSRGSTNYPERLKKDGKFNIDEAIVFN